MRFNQSYFFFLLITTFGAFVTIKICTTAYSSYDYEGSVPVHAAHHTAIDPNLDTSVN
jgi:hypothetical protein